MALQLDGIEGDVVLELDMLEWEVVLELEVKHVCSFLVQMSVTGDGAQAEFASDAIRTYQKELISKVDLEDRINTVIMTDGI